METEIGRILNELNNQFPDDLLDIDFSKYSDIDLDLDDIEEPKEKEQYDPKANWVTADESKLNDNFWKWFGYSYAVKNGKPLVLYHGTPSDKITEFDNSRNASTSGRSVWGRGGFYFTAQESTAKEYGKNIIPVFLSIQRPFKSGWSKLKLDVMFKLMYGREPNQENDDLQLEYLESKLEYPADLLQTLTDKNGKWGYSLEEIMEANGYDSIIDGHVFIALYPNQIKSVDNNGEWSTNSNNIYEKLELDSNKVYYHGSNAKFTTFDKSKIKENKLGLAFNFTDDIGMAYQYGDNIMKVHLDLNNPLTLNMWDDEFPYEWFNKFAKLFTGEDDYEYDKEDYAKHPYTFGKFYNTYGNKPEGIQILEEMGYDGIAIPEDHHYGVFEPEQIHIINDVGESKEDKLQQAMNLLNKVDGVISLDPSFFGEFGKTFDSKLDRVMKIKSPKTKLKRAIELLKNAQGSLIDEQFDDLNEMIDKFLAIQENYEMAEKKLDKYTAYIDAFKVACDQLSKDNVDTNNNGIEIKKNKKGEDEFELTPGQKSIVWESYKDKVKRLVSEKLKKEVNEISDELKNKVADKRKENMDKAIAKYTKNQTLNKTHSKADIKKAEPKVAWDTDVQSDYIMVWSPLKFTGNVEDLMRVLNNSNETDIDDFDYDLTASDRDGDSYEGETANVDLWVRRAENKKGTECSIRITFPDTDDYIWVICPTYDKFTKFLKEVAYFYLGEEPEDLISGMQILDNLINENSTKGESNGGGTPEEAGKIVKEIINYLKKNGGGTLYNDHFEITENGAEWDIRDWGSWELPDDAEDEEDYDWEVLNDEYEADLQDILSDFELEYPNYDITYDIGEKNYIGIYVTVKSKNESFNENATSKIIEFKTENLVQPIICEVSLDEYGSGKGKYISGFDKYDTIAVRMLGNRNTDVYGFKIVEIGNDFIIATHPKSGDEYKISFDCEVSYGKELRFDPYDNESNWFAFLDLVQQKYESFNEAEDDKLNALANALEVEPTEIQQDGNIYSVKGLEDFIVVTEKSPELKDIIKDGLLYDKNLIWDVYDTGISLQDFIELFCSKQGTDFIVDGEKMADYLVEKGYIPSNIQKTNYKGVIYYYMEA